MMYDAFISHASPDLVAATRLNDCLKANGLKTFFAPTDLPGACVVQKGLVQAIENSTAVVVLMSPAAVESRWVLMEVDVATRRERLVAPVRLDDYHVPIDSGLYPYTLNLNYIDLFPDWDFGKARLLRVLQPAAHDAMPVAAGPAEAGDGARAPASERSPARDAAGPSKDSASRSSILARLERRAGRGDREAMYLLGRFLLETGMSSESDARAARLLHLAADGDRALPQALHLLGDCYRKNRGVGRNYASMLSFYERAAARGYAPAIYNLGRTFEYGWGVRRDLARACRRYQAAAQLGFAPAQYAVARMNFEGEGILANDANMLSFAQMAAAQHFGPALNLLGRLYRKGRGVPQSDAKACVWYERAADQGDVAGILNLASMYERGLGVKPDKTRAKSLRALADEITGRFED